MAHATPPVWRTPTVRRRARAVALVLAALGAVTALALLGLALQPQGTAAGDRAGAGPAPGTDPGRPSAGPTDRNVTATVRTTVSPVSASTPAPATASTTGGATGPSTASPATATSSAGTATGRPAPRPGDVFVAQGEGFSAAAGPTPVDKGTAENGASLGFIEDGDWVSYSGVDVPGAATFSARVASNTSGGTIEIRDQDPFGPVLGVVTVPATGGWESFTTVSTPMSAGPSGTLVLRFTGGTGYLLDIDTFTVSPD